MKTLKAAVQGLLALWSSAAVAHAAPSPSSDDIHVMQELAKGSSAEIELGRFIEGKSGDASVKSFAERMIKDHQKLLGEAQDWARGRKVALDTKPGEEEEKVLRNVRPLSGTNLDVAYIEGMLDDHKTDVSKVAHYISMHPNSSVTSSLKSALPVLEDHLRMAENVAGHLGIKPDAGLTHP